LLTRLINDEVTSNTVWLLALASSISFALPFLTRRTGSRTPASMIIMFIGVTVTQLRAWSTGGIDSTASNVQRVVITWVCLATVIGLASVQHSIVLGLEPQVRLVMILGFVGAGFGVLMVWVSEHLAKSRRLHAEVVVREAAIRDLNEQLESIVAERTARMLEQERELQTARRVESIGRLSAGVAHDLNTLLTSMGGYAWLVLQEGALPGDDSTHRIIDADDPIIRQLTLRLLTRDGLEVATAGSVQEAMACCTNGAHFDVVLSDVQLPDGRGTLLVQDILRGGHADRAVIISGHMTTQAIDDIQRMPSVPVLGKRFNPDLSLKAVRGNQP
jgi:CheY-like chemotaxis protein